ncbi:MAG: hypothetical protein Kow0049_01080 [Stanieria sp.]
MKYYFKPEQLLTFTFTFSLLSVPVKAQIIPDNSLGTTVTTLDGNTFTIEGGTTAGNNLFHSFSQFSLLTGKEASFNNTVTITNIISRVTGGKISSIDGLLRASGSANLFLINPTGIIVGKNASLDIGGSFFASTADSLLFPEGEFSAVDAQNTPLITINAPIGWNFRDNPQPITNQSTANGVGLEVETGKNITLVGGNINFAGGKLTAPGGKVELGGLSTAGEIGIGSDGSLTFPNGIAKADVTLTNGAALDVSGSGGGLININANHLQLNQKSLILAGIQEGFGSSDAIAGTININANSIRADNDSEIRSETEGIGDAGTININTNNLNFVDGSAIVVSTFGKGDAGTVNLNAKNIFFDREWGGIYSTVGLRRIEIVKHATDAIGNGGKVNINTETLSLTNGARILGNTIAQGDAGDIDINATGAVSYIGQGVTPVPAFGDDPVISGSFSQVREGASGSGGQVSIKADSLTLIDKGAVLVDNQGGEGDAGDITIDVQNKLFSDQTGLILSQVQEGAEGNGGNININAGSFEATGGTFILADTKGKGNAGNISINVERTLSLDEGSSILTEVAENAQGKGGAITINANSVIVKNGARINSLTKGEGDAGNINITADDYVLLENDGAILGQVTENAQGNGSLIEVNTDSLTVTNESQLSVDNQGQGQAGNISISANSLELNDRGKITANTISGEGGNIDLEAGNLLLRDNSSISAQATGEANGGNVTIDTDFVVAFPNQNNDIIADAQQGNGGNITIKAQSVFGIEERPLNAITNDINASSASGAQFDGVVEIITPDVDPFQETAETPENVVDSNQVVAGVCNTSELARNINSGKANTFTVNGKGGIPPEPTEPFAAENIFINGQSIPAVAEEERALQEQYPPILTSQGAIYPARGMVKNPDGTVILTAYPTGNIQGVPHNSSNCGV